MSTSSLTSSTPASQTLTQANFLQLLVTQMTSQDPLNPESDTEFASQLAQFSALQQSQNMAGDMQELQANSLIGSTVSVTSTTNTTQANSGVVSGVDMSSGSPEIVVNGTSYPLSQLISVSPTAAPTTAPATTSTASNSSTSSN